MEDYYIVNGQKIRRDWTHDDIVWSFRQADYSFKQWWFNGACTQGNAHGAQYIPPWIFNRNRYVVDDYGNLVSYLPYFEPDEFRT